MVRIGLSDCRALANIPVTDVARSRQFYEGVLGLEGGIDRGDGGVTYPCGGASAIHIYASPGNAGASTATLSGWIVDDVEGLVDELASRGVDFESYDTAAIKTDDRGVADFGDVRAAWFKDPDGNILSVING